MADYQFPGQNQWSEKPAIGTGEGESPLMSAPQNDITMRTMASDTNSIKEMGGGDPRPYIPTAQTQQAQSPTINPTQTAEIPVVPLPPQKGSNTFVIAAIVIIILGLGAIGYFYVYPKFISSGDELTQETTETIKEESPLPVNQEIATENSTTSTSTVEILVPSGLASHVSLFKTAADFSSETTLVAETVEAIKEAWKGTTVEVPVFKETVFKTNDGKIFGSSKLVSLFLPTFMTASSSKLFEEDFTLFTYTDQKGVWPGIILKAKQESLVLAKDESKKIESNTEWRNLYMQDPGKEQAWKDGKVSTETARYIPFSIKGNALSYTWFNDTLLISTSYQGAQDAAKKLGY